MVEIFFVVYISKGKSKGYLNLTQKNTALFHGHLSNEFDKPEKTNSL
jgi:hypothetical protein